MKMSFQKIGLHLLLVFSPLCALWSQSIYLGAKAGGQLSSAFIDHTLLNHRMEEGVKWGAHGGFVLKFFPEPRDTFIKSGLQLSVNYVQRGWRQSFTSDIPTYFAQMDYLEIPLEGFGYFGKKTKFFLGAGFYLEALQRYSLDPTPDFDTDIDGNSIPNQVDGQDFYTYDATRDPSIGYGARVSGGVFRDFAIGQLQLEGFFTYSISNFMDPGRLLGDVPDISNLWSAGLGLVYLFPLKKKSE